MVALKKLSAKKYAKRKARNFLMKTIVLHHRMQRNRYFSSIMQTSLFSLFVRNRRIWAYERNETWFTQMLTDVNDPNFELRWRN